MYTENRRTLTNVLNGILALLPYISLIAVNVPLLFLTMPLDGLQCVIMIFPDHTLLRFDRPTKERLGEHYSTNVLFF